MGKRAPSPSVRVVRAALLALCVAASGAAAYRCSAPAQPASEQTPRTASLGAQSTAAPSLLGIAPVRAFDKARLARAILEGGQYLQRMSEPGGGVHKYYFAEEDAFEPKVHTVYTASTVLTLLKLKAWSQDEALTTSIQRSAQFLLGMQSSAADATHGGFFYSMDLQRQEHDCKLRVGTTAKALFTLLELHRRQPGAGYLEHATRAGDFLLRMQRVDGSVTSGVTCAEAKAAHLSGRSRESLLYTGQVLSALSRLYAVTREPRFLDGAARTAVYLQEKVARHGCYVGDAYRRPNPVSSSWVVMSLLDFAKATQDGAAEATAFRCGEHLAGMQQRDARAPLDYGRWRGSLSSSGAGWLAEVMSELYLHCRTRPALAGCGRYRDSAAAAFWLLLEHTAGPGRSASVRNPDAALGGIFWSSREPYIRTDSVCHGLNAYLNLMPHLPDGALVSLEDAAGTGKPPVTDADEADPDGADADE